MATPTMSPPGWYADPSGRHEGRYWDGTAWTMMVADRGATTTDPAGLQVPAPNAPPPAPPPPPPPSAGPPSIAAPVGYRVLGASRGRVAALSVAQLSLMLTLLFELFASVFLYGEVHRGALVPPSLGELQWSAWMFHYGSNYVIYGYPPLGVWVVLLVAVIAITRMSISPLGVLRRAGSRGWTRRSNRAKFRQLAQGLDELGCAKTMLRVRGRRGLLVVAEISSFVLIGLATYAVTARQGTLLESQTYTNALTLGAGPVVCLIAGILAAVAGLFAWPWTAEREIVVFPDGSVRADQPHN